jgi:hypothetical protein
MKAFPTRIRDFRDPKNHIHARHYQRLCLALRTEVSIPCAVAMKTLELFCGESVPL